MADQSTILKQVGYDASILRVGSPLGSLSLTSLYSAIVNSEIFGPSSISAICIASHFLNWKYYWIADDVLSCLKSKREKKQSK